jgi:DNA-directed RNA polymerase alpha subunit
VNRRQRETVEGLVKKPDEDLDAIVDFGRKSLDEVRRRMDNDEGPGREPPSDDG